jgi:monoamine oxidase
VISRRQFVQSCAAAAAITAMPGRARAARPRIAIIGSGAAGISAARTLRAGNVEVVILEARNRLGGRAFTDTTTLGVPWDRGGSWLHSSEINPLVPIAKSFDLEVYADEASRHLYRGSTRLDPSVNDAVRALRERAYAELAAAAESGADIPAFNALSAATRADPLFPVVESDMRGFEGVELEHYSTLDSFNYVEAGPDLFIPSGYGALIARLAGDLAVTYGEAVRRVDWSGPRVRLDTHSGRIEADAAIVTVPTSILVRGELVFTPALPIVTEQAIHDLPLGLLDKVGMLLDPGVLPTAPNEFVSLANAAPEAFGFHTRIWGSSALLGYLSGTYAHQLELEGEAALVAAATAQLATIFGAGIRRSIRQTSATRWASEPWSFGSYSHCVPGRFGARAVLTRPVADRIFFAGEHTQQSAYGTIHGAWMSGERAAQDALSRLGVARVDV